LLTRRADGAPRAAALGNFSGSRHPLASLLTRDLSLAAHPCAAAADGAAVGDLVAACERWARARGATRLLVDSFMSGMSPWVPAADGYRESTRVEFLVDLTRETTALWQAIKKDQRERIRRLPREGITVEPGSSLDDMRGLGAVRQATQAKRARRGQGYDLATDESFYAALHERLVKPGAGRLFVARQAGEVVAAIFFTAFNRIAYSTFSGSTEAAYRIGAQSGLYWLAVETFKAEGFTVLNRGGVPAAAESEGDPLHGIYQFKLRLGTAPVRCRSGQKVLRPLRHRLGRILRDRLGR
ncbi:MAG: GNAT family N-acetyltransferase, partial [Candidatus Rokubacteria bacterium]|nr:GNAT family N-acetyltransferase [Candidatus Rokubacteria bacterium]